ncbi:MAG: hypothetical protein ABH851_04810 [Methanobacteriota archaeon]
MAQKRKAKKPVETEMTWREAQKHYLAFELASLLHFMETASEANPETPVLVIGNGGNGRPPVHALKPFLRDRGFSVNTSVRVGSRAVDTAFYKFAPSQSEFSKGGALNSILTQNPLIFIVDNSPGGVQAAAHIGFKTFSAF